MIVTILLIIGIAPLAVAIAAAGTLWIIGYIDSLSDTCVCGVVLERGRCTHPLNHQPIADWPVPVTYQKREPLALPRGDR